MYRFSIPAFALTLILGCLTGSTVTALLAHRPPPLMLTDDPGADVPVVNIQGIRNGALIGTASSGVRLAAGGRAVALNASGAFAIRHSDVLTNVIQIIVPPGQKFVASKRGKKYYPVESSQGQRIVPENRVYFPDAASARQAGYLP